MTDGTIDLGTVYQRARGRIGELVSPGVSAQPVPACPGWSVHDVVSHLVAVVEDVMAGRLTRPPTDEETAEQVSRRRDRTTRSVVEEWADLAPPFEQFLSSVPVWPAALDVLSHEQDLRGAIGSPGARDDPGLLAGAVQLVSTWSPPVPLVVHMDGMDQVLGPPGTDQPLSLTTTSYEAFRFRLGRRSRNQLARMAWSADPAPVLGTLTIFGPSPTDIVE